MIARHRPVLLAAALLVGAGCGSASTPTSTTAPPSVPGGSGPSPQSTLGPASPPATTEPRPEEPTPAAGTLEVTVSDGDVAPAPDQVDLAVGETLTVVVTSDRDSEVHAHGFEVTEPVPAGEPTTVELTGTSPGVYEVELHDPDLLLLQVAVR